MEVMEIVFQFLDAKVEEQRRFHHAVREEYERTAVIEEINGPHGLIKMATIITDSGQMNAFARSKQGGQIAIIVQQSPTTGSIQIFTNSYNRLQLFDLAKMIRLEEQECRDGMVTVTDWRRLASEGTMDEVPEWYFHTKGQMLLNGSTTATNITPTKISLMRIKELIRIALDPNTFESPDCKRLCWSSRREPCPWFKWGMTRCYKLRQARGEY